MKSPYVCHVFEVHDSGCTQRDDEPAVGFDRVRIFRDRSNQYVEFPLTVLAPLVGLFQEAELIPTPYPAS